MSTPREPRGFIRCRTCIERTQTERLEVGLSASVLVVRCPKHGVVVELTPDSLAALLAHPPTCDCCGAVRQVLS